MPAKTPKSRLSKSATKKSGFKFRWWMGVALIAVVAVVGVLVLRFSQASGGSRTFSVDAGTIQPGGGAAVGPATKGRELGYTASANTIPIFAGAYAQAQESYQNIIGSNNPNDVENANIRVCFTFYAWNTTYLPDSYSLEILDWGGNQVAVQPGTQYAPGTVSKCVEKTVGSPRGDHSFFYRLAGTKNPNGSGGLFVVTASRQTLAVNRKGGNNPTNPEPPAPPPQTEWDYSKNGVSIKSSCAPAVGEGADLVCPKDETGFEYVGGADPSVAAPDNTEHNIGIWKRTVNGSSMCGIKSKPGSPLNFRGGDKLWILPECPQTASQVLQRLGGDCQSENADFINNVVLRPGAESYCILYAKAFQKIVLLGEYYPMTWQDPVGVWDQAAVDDTKAYQQAISTALQNYNFDQNDDAKAARQYYLDNGFAKQGSDGKLYVDTTGNFAKAEWNWLVVLTYLYIIENQSKGTY